MASRTATIEDKIERLLDLTASASTHKDSIIALLQFTDQVFSSKPWNVYNYNDPEIYKNMAFSDSEWQWEFTRRNEIYRRLWLADYLDVGHRIPTEKMCNDIFGSLWLSDPNIGVLDIREQERVWRPTSNNIFPPTFESTVKFIRDYRPARVICEGESLEYLRFTNHTQFYFRFDTDYPIGNQLAEIKRVFQQTRKKVKRASRLAWPEYLRVWDAAADGLSLSRMALLLTKAKNEQSARDSLRAARNIVRSCATVF